MTAITKQLPGDNLFIVRGKDQGRPAWHYILVPYSKVNVVQNLPMHGTIDVKKFGEVIQYNGNQYTSDWGENPPEKVKKWLEKRYGTYKSILIQSILRKITQCMISYCCVLICTLLLVIYNYNS